MRALTGSTFATDDGAYHAGYIGYNRRDETFNALYYVPQGDAPDCVDILMGPTLSRAHYARTISRVFTVMGFSSTIAEEFADGFVTSDDPGQWGTRGATLSGWTVTPWTNIAYKAVTISRDGRVRCGPPVQVEEPVEEEPVIAGYVMTFEAGEGYYGFQVAEGSVRLNDLHMTFTEAILLGTEVLSSGSYGPWLTAIRNPDGVWIGTLTETELTTNHCYTILGFDTSGEIRFPSTARPIPRETPPCYLRDSDGIPILTPTVSVLTEEGG